MRILSIRFQNLNSLRGGHEVNLESGPLAEAGLFAITGPTGAGKSTILDAVTLALYARAARYGRDTAEDMMSRGAGECSATVEFSCESGRYTARWLLRRARGKAGGNLQPLKHELSQDAVIIEDKTRGVVQKIEELTGLDYDRFLRSVLLAQGQFAAFLRAEKDERADLLERITGSHIYSELGALAWQISAGHARDIAQESIRLGAVILLPGEARAEISERLTTLCAELTALEGKRAILTIKVAAAKRGAELCRQMEEYAAAMASHATAVASFATEEGRLVQHAATAPFSEALSALGESERAAQHTAAGAVEAAGKLDAARAAAGMAAGAALAAIAAESAAADGEQRVITEKRKQVAEELAASQKWIGDHSGDAALAEKLPELSAAVQHVTSLTDRCSAAERKCQSARREAARAAEEAKQIALKGAAVRQLSDKAAGEAVEAKAALTALLTEPCNTGESVEREVQRLANTAEALQRMLAADSALTEQATRIAALESGVKSMESRAARLSAEDHGASEKLEAAKQRESLLQELVRHEHLLRTMEEHRAHLEAGKPCPLCGAAEHPWAKPDAMPAPDSAGERLKQHQREQRVLEKAAKTAAGAAVDADKSLAAARAQQQAMQAAWESSRLSLSQEWRAHSPETECTAEAIAIAVGKTAENLTALSALAEKVRTAAGRERAAGAAAERADGEANLCQARAAAAENNATAAANAEREAGDERQRAAVDLAAAKNALQAALISAGEPAGGDDAAALKRLKARERAWREAMDLRARLEKQAVILQHDLEKCALHAKSLEERGRETREAIAHAGLTAARVTATDGAWVVVQAAFAKALADSHAAKSLAASTSESAQKAVEVAAEQFRALTAALADSGFADIAAVRTAQLDAVTLKALTKRRDELRDTTVRLDLRRENLAGETAALEEEWRRMGTIPAAADGLPGLEEALATLTREANSLRMECGALQQRLDSDDEVRVRHAAAVTELEKQKSAAAPWARLCELIGSADGDKFSRCAQSITLDHLTALANARLTQLCDRYRLLRCGAASDLALQVLDAWQADTVRPMESLSGGETFLVSLALALGLSELAGRRTRIGTLFIDEGFGTLDSTALDIALSALEGLRAGHSTIGIISHVEALKVRLTTQVEVVRGPGGWSRLEVRT